MSQLLNLIGRRVQSLTHDVSLTLPIRLSKNTKNTENFDLYLQLLFDGNYVLNIYNNHSLGNASDLQDLVNEVLSSIEEKESEIIFSFKEKSIKVDMSDSGFTGPESMSLYGPNDLIVVWD